MSCSFMHQQYWSYYSLLQRKCLLKLLLITWDENIRICQKNDDNDDAHPKPLYTNYAGAAHAPQENKEYVCIFYIIGVVVSGYIILASPG